MLKNPNYPTLRRNQISLFASTRKKALDIWLKTTNRALHPKPYKGFHFDTFEDAFECSWQRQSCAIKNNNDWHVPHFCSLGEWASNITDLLTDSRFDNLSFTNEQDIPFLYRHYTRFLLVVSEMINDFVDIMYLVCKPSDEKRIWQKSFKRDLVPKIGDANKLTQFINCTCKHKAGESPDGQSGKQKTFIPNLHHHNHHLPIGFEDSVTPFQFNSRISWQTPHPPQPDSIYMPSLVKVTQVVSGGYQFLDNYFRKHPKEFENFIESGRTYND